MKETKKHNRITITVGDSLNDQLNRLKQERYYHTSYAEMLRDLLELGLKTAEETSQENKKK